MTRESTDAASSPPYRDRIYGRYVSAFKGGGSPEQLAASFERHASFFDQLFDGVLEPGRRVSLLEVGCGAGPLLYWARARGIGEVAGFDLSPEQVEAARSLGLPAEVGSYRDLLPGRAAEYDVVVGLDLIEHLTRDEVFEFLDLCRVALRPGGTVFFTTPNGAGLRYGPVRYGDLTHETIFTPETISLALRLCGFEDVSVREVIPPPHSLRSRARRALWSFVRLWPMVVDLVETGARSSVYSRNMAVCARRTT